MNSMSWIFVLGDHFLVDFFFFVGVCAVELVFFLGGGEVGV